MAKKSDLNAGFNPFDGHPDVSKCSARPSGIADLACCLMDNAVKCEYAEPFHDKIVCFHPQREDIIKRTISFRP